MAKVRYRSSKFAPKPTTAAAAAPMVRKFAVNLFDRHDGEAANWLMIAEVLLKVGFDLLDKSDADDPRQASLLRRIHAGSYDRLVQNPAYSFETSDSFDGSRVSSFSPTYPSVSPGRDRR